MSQPRRLPGTTPAAFSRTGQDVPPSPEVAAAAVADRIGMATALHLGQLLEPVFQLLAEQQRSRACIVCAAKVKRAHDAWEREAAIRRQAGESDPDQPDLGVTESFTDGMRGPVCWGCFDPDVDAYPEPGDTGSFGALLPPAAD